MEKIIYPKNDFLMKSHSLEGSEWEKQFPYYNTYQNQNFEDISQTNKIKTPLPIFNNDLDIKLENTKNALRSKINQNSQKKVLYLEKIKNLTQENLSLKEIIKNKNKIISDYEHLFFQIKAKFMKMDYLNQTLKNKLLNRKDLGIDFIQNDLLFSFNDIKEDLEKIEFDYDQKFKEKDEILGKMNQELIYIHGEYKKLTENLERMNNYIINAGYNVPKNNNNNSFSKEQNNLMEGNGKIRKRVIGLQNKNENIYEKDNENFDNCNDNNELIVTFKNQGNEYDKKMNRLHN